MVVKWRTDEVERWEERWSWTGSLWREGSGWWASGLVGMGVSGEARWWGVVSEVAGGKWGGGRAVGRDEGEWGGEVVASGVGGGEREVG